MKLRIACVPIIVIVTLGGVSGAKAENNTDDGDQFVYGKVGTLGAGVGFGKSISEKVTLRIGVSGGAEYTGDQKYSGVDYDIKDKPGAVLEAMADWHPITGSGFRLTGGLMINSAKNDLTGKKDSSGKFSINDHAYSASAVGDLKGTTHLRLILVLDGNRTGEARRDGASSAMSALPISATEVLRFQRRGIRLMLYFAKTSKRKNSNLPPQFNNRIGLVLSIGTSYSF